VAVADLSFHVARGEVFGLLGPNGAGKTTTIRMVLDLIQPTAGRIRVLGERMSEALKDRIGYLPEERGLYRDVSVLDGLVYLACLKGLGRAEARRRALVGLERLGLADAARSPVKALSRGMQQKVQLLATVLHEPELLIVDEPFSGLDPVNTLALRDLLFELRSGGTTIVMSEHQMNRVEELCERILMLQHGRMVLYGDVAGIRARFSGGTVLVAADGELGDLEGAREVGVRDGLVELALADGVDPTEILQRIAARPGLGLRHFEVHTPSLEEIFIRVAGAPS
jgi:ABC-2 type transport system ATP-binding protein